MLTQRIGKSANEFLTMEGVSPEAVFLLGKDLNSFREIAQAWPTAIRNCVCRDQRPADQGTPGRAMKQYEETRTQAARFWAPARSGVCP